jgi:hypothetical protein
MTKGERRVRISFNPNDNPEVTRLNQAAASQLLVEVKRDTRSFETHCPPRSAPTAR